MKKRREQLVCLRRRIVQRNEKLGLFLNLAFVGDVAHLFFEFYTGRENHVWFDAFNVERFCVCRSLACE